MAVKLDRKPKGSYHHPGLEQALVDAAIRTIREHGIDGLTLRDIGAQLGVSRTAIYRHFKDKSALLARVSFEGFRLFRQSLRSTVDAARARGADPIEEMGVAYIGFALANQSHYKTMFGGTFDAGDRYPDVCTEAAGAFEVLLSTITEERAAAGIAEQHHPLQLARILWASVHGIATLGMAGSFARDGETATLEDLARVHARILLAGLR